MKDKDIISLFAMFFIFLIFLYFGKSLLDNVNTKQKQINEKREYKEPVQIKYEEHKLSDKSFNTYDNNNYIENDGFVNELLPKSTYKLPTNNFNNQFTEAKYNIPIDRNLCNKGFKPLSKEYKTDLPLPNVPTSYILDSNKSVKLSEQIKKNF